MFTGIVIGTVAVLDLQPSDQGKRLTIGRDGLGVTPEIGESIALNGTCLTVAEVGETRVCFDLAGETLRLTNFGDLQPGDALNVERSLRLGDRLDGHMVQGHVDGVGEVRSFERQGDDRWLVVAAAPDLLRQTILKGSITVDGISLTVAALDAETFACTIIPHTWEITNLRTRSNGERVNLEVDPIGKWVRRVVEEMHLPESHE